MTQVVHTANLSKVYRTEGDSVRALRNVSFSIEPGESLAVMGPSGSGKSTLMNLLGLLDSPSEGSYWLQGNDVSGLTSDQQALSRNRKIGFVFQAFNLLSRNTAAENVELPLIYGGVGTAERRRRANAALDSVGLGHRRDRWPHQLSGGEQQRVAIARAIVNEPALLLADEPTGALDSQTGKEILALFQMLNESGRTVVLVTHDPIVAQYTRRIITLQDGYLVSDEPVAAPVTARNSPTTLPGNDEASSSAAVRPSQ